MATMARRSGIVDYVRRMWELRHFLQSLILMDLRARYKRSALGIGWSLMRPLALTGVFCLVFCRLFSLDPIDYAPFVLCGLTLWSFIVDSAISGCNCFNQNASYIRQESIPLALFPLRTVVGSGIHALIALALTLALILVARGLPSSLGFLAAIPMLLMLFVFCWSMAVVLGLLHTHFPDTQHLAEILFSIVFYLTPIAYPPSITADRPRFAMVLEANPFTHMIEAIRRPILDGQLASWSSYAIIVAVVLGAFGIALLTLKKLQRELVYWL